MAPGPEGGISVWKKVAGVRRVWELLFPRLVAWSGHLDLEREFWVWSSSTHNVYETLCSQGTLSLSLSFLPHQTHFPPSTEPSAKWMLKDI